MEELAVTREPHVLEIEDYTVFNEGDVFPKLNKKIGILFIKDKDFIVFLDDSKDLHWYYSESYGEFPPDYGEVVAREERLQATSHLVLSEFQCQIMRPYLGESIARLMDDRNSENARKILDQAESYLEERCRERAKIWYLTGSAVTALLILLLFVGLWLLKPWMIPKFGLSEAVFEIFLGIALGPLGAILSVLIRQERITLNTYAGVHIHLFEGAIRAVLGAIGALLTALAVKANLLLGAINKAEGSLLMLCVVCLIAGASERLVPSLIQQFEGFFTKGITMPDGPVKTGPRKKNQKNR